MKRYCHCGKVAKFTVVKHGTFLCAAHANECGESTVKLGKDDFVPAGQIEQWTAFLKTQGMDTLAVYRWADDNDSAAYHFGTLWRVCQTREEALEMVERSNKQRYMGRKRHKWYAACPFVMGTEKAHE
jgi:hypothetical protein